jgi:hypothetical protein
MLTELRHWHKRATANVALMFREGNNDRMAPELLRPAASRRKLPASHIYGHHARSIVRRVVRRKLEPVFSCRGRVEVAAAPNFQHTPAGTNDRSNKVQQDLLTAKRSACPAGTFRPKFPRRPAGGRIAVVTADQPVPSRP